MYCLWKRDAKVVENTPIVEYRKMESRKSDDWGRILKSLDMIPSHINIFKSSLKAKQETPLQNILYNFFMTFAPTPLVKKNLEVIYFYRQAFKYLTQVTNFSSFKN